MTVKEFRESLARFEDKARVVVYWENQDQQSFFEINDLSVPKGKPQRDKDGKPGLKFDESSLAPRVFININQDV